MEELVNKITTIHSLQAVRNKFRKSMLRCILLENLSMDIYSETHHTRNKIAWLYQETFMDLDLYNHTYDFACNIIKKSQPSILDVGCGPWNITAYLLSKNPSYNVMGTDIAPNMIDLAHKNNPTAEFVLMDTRNIATLHKSFDGIFCGFCMPYLSLTDCRVLIDDCYWLLDSWGFLYISFVEWDSHLSGYKTSSSWHRLYFYFHTSKVIKKYLTDSKFEILKTYNIPYQKSVWPDEVHTVIIAKKAD